MPENKKFTHEAIDVSKNVLPYITLIKTKKTIGKSFTPDKQRAIQPNYYQAKILPCATLQEYEAILDQLDETEAIILGVPSGAVPDEEFIIPSEALMQQLVGGDKDTDVHGWWTDEDGLRYVCRFASQWLYSTVRLFDLDVPEGTPESLCHETVEQWLSDIGLAEPALLGTELLVSPSSTARVMGAASGRWHVNFTVPAGDACDIDDLADHFLAVCHARHMTWDNAGSLTPIYDRAVMKGSQRVVFAGPPAVSGGAELIPAERYYVNDGAGAIDITKMQKLSREDIARVASACNITTVGVAWDEVWSTRDHGDMTLREYAEGGYEGEHIRCQIHQRGSTSMNGYFGCHDDGEVFVYDHGNSTKYMPSRRELSETIGKLSSATVAVMAEKFAKLRGTGEGAVAKVDMKDRGMRATVPEMRERFVLIGGNFVGDLKRPYITPVRLNEFRNMQSGNRETVIGANDKPKMVPRSRLWEEDSNRKQVDDMGFIPDEEPLYNDHDGKLYFNLWCPLPLVTRDANTKGAHEFIQHLTELIPNDEDRNYFLDFMAHTLQKPGERPATAPVLYTPVKGTGRGFTRKVMNKLLGRYGMSVAFKSLVEGGFNEHLNQTLMVTAEEVLMDNNPMTRLASSTKLRDLITADDIVVDVKYGPKFRTSCYTRIVMHTNHADALAFDGNERRFYIIRCTDIKMTNDAKKLRYGMINNRDDVFLRDIRAMLMARDLSNFDAMSDAPETHAKGAMVAMGDSELMRAVKDRIADFRENGVALISVNDLRLAVENVVSADEFEEIKAGILSRGLKDTHCETLPVTKVDGHPVRLWAIKEPRKWQFEKGRERARRYKIDMAQMKLPEGKRRKTKLNVIDGGKVEDEK